MVTVELDRGAVDLVRLGTVVGVVLVVVERGAVVDVTADVVVRTVVVSGRSDSPSGDVREMYKGSGDVLTDPAMA